MLEFFRGWKRKAGCVTLVLACVFAVGWMRSRDTFDAVYLCKQFIIFSARDQLIVSKQLELTFPEQGMTWKLDPSLTGAVHWWSGSATSMSNLSSRPRMISYWAIVVPLTAISTWLLLSKPRTRVESPITPASENA